MKEVTNSDLLNQLNRTQQYHDENPIGKIESKPSMNALGVLARSAFNAPGEAIGNLMLKLGLTNPEVMEQANPRNEAYEQGRMEHPLADFTGGMLGFGPVGLGTSTVIRSIPGVSAAIARASPSLLKRTAVHGLEGGAIGSIYAPPGQEGEGFGMGALIGGLLGGPGVSLARNSARIKSKSKNVLNLEELQGEKATAEKMNLEQQRIIDSLLKKYKSEPGSYQSPESFSKAIAEKLNEKNQLQPTANTPFEQTENLLTEPLLSENIPKLDNEIENIKREKTHYLSSPKPHGVEFAEDLYKSVSQAKKYIQKENYKPVEDYSKQAHIRFPRTEDVAALDSQLEQFYNGKLTKTEPAFEKVRREFLEKYARHDLIPAYDYIQNWKSTKQAAAKARRLGFKEGGENQAHWQNEALALQNIADKQLSVLEKQLPKEYFQKLAEGDKLWKENIIPFYGNKIYEQSRPVANRGKIDAKDIMHEIRAGESGQEKVRELILSHPNLTRLALGHKYASNPEGLLSASPYEQQFIDQLPALKGYIDRLKKAQFNKKVSEIHQKGQERRLSELAEENKRMKKEQQERIKAQDQIKKIDDTIETLKVNRDKLKQELNQGKITEEEFKRLDREVSETLKIKEDFKNKLIKILGYGAIAIGVNNAIKSLLR